MSRHDLYQVLGALGCFFIPNLLYLILGLIFYRFNFSHKFGLRCLAMSVFCKGDFVASKCRLDCSNCACGNWTCSKYSQPRNKRAS